MSSSATTITARSKTAPRSTEARINSPAEKPQRAAASLAKSAAKTEAKPGAAGPRQEISASTARKEIIFRLEAPSAARVALAADFTNWDQSPINMTRGKDGVWQATVPLTQGRHAYKFLVDGAWRADPNCALQVPNQFGTTNAVIEVR